MFLTNHITVVRRTKSSINPATSNRISSSFKGPHGPLCSASWRQHRTRENCAHQPSNQPTDKFQAPKTLPVTAELLPQHADVLGLEVLELCENPHSLLLWELILYCHVRPLRDHAGSCGIIPKLCTQVHRRRFCFDLDPFGLGCRVAWRTSRTTFRTLRIRSRIRLRLGLHHFRRQNKTDGT